jgi:hypothetical protein
MKYLKSSSVNLASGAVETVLAEGHVGERPWVALECVDFNHNAIANSNQLQYGRSSCLTRRVIRIRCTDLGLQSYLVLLVENWTKLMEDLASMEDSDGHAYNIHFNGCPHALWDGECEKTGEFYVEFDVGSSTPIERYQDAAEEFMKEMSVIFVRMAAVGPNTFDVSITLEK